MTHEAALRFHEDESGWIGHKECAEYIPVTARHRVNRSRQQANFYSERGWSFEKPRADFELVRLPVARIVQEERTQQVAAELRRLVDEWKAATFMMSSIQQKVIHPAYQQIIGFGEQALPFLVEELRVSDGFWFWALRMIAREDPVRPEDRGNYAAMKHAWLTWAEQKNL